MNDSSELIPRRNGLRVYKGFRGALGIVHGAGETLRGNIIGAVDTLLGGKHEAEATSVAQRGREEVRTGVERMRGRSKGTTAEGQSQEQEPVQEREQARPQGQTSEQQQPRPQAAPQAAPRGQVQEPDQSRELGQQREAPPERVEKTVQPKEQVLSPVQQESSKPKSEKAEGSGEDPAGGTYAPETVPATSS